MESLIPTNIIRCKSKCINNLTCKRYLQRHIDKLDPPYEMVFSNNLGQKKDKTNTVIECYDYLK